jgi:endoglycosylceramidase
MSFHDYCLTAGSQAACDTFDDLVFANAQEHSRATGDSLLLTEFGATKDPTVLVPMVERADRNMIGWQFWHYCGCDDPTTSGPGDAQALVADPRKPPKGDNLDTGKLALLSRPYPRSVSGTPTAWSWADGVFELRWKARRGRTEIVVPRRQFPHGYTVHGARVRSRPRARVLVVTAKPGDRTVQVRRSTR